MKHNIRTILDTQVDDEVYRSAGPVDRLADGSLDAGVVMALRFRAACLNVEGVQLVDINTIRWRKAGGKSEVENP